MEKIKEMQSKNVGFEVLGDDDDSVVLKRLIGLKGKSKDERLKIELRLPKITIRYFDKDDLDTLKEIETDIYNYYLKNSSESTFKTVFVRLMEKLAK